MTDVTLGESGPWRGTGTGNGGNAAIRKLFCPQPMAPWTDAEIAHREYGFANLLLTSHSIFRKQHQGGVTRVFTRFRRLYEGIIEKKI